MSNLFYKFLEFLNPNYESIDIITKKFNNLSNNDKQFIEEKINELEVIDSNISKLQNEELRGLLFELQFKTLRLFLSKKIPDCNNELKQIFDTIKNKIEIVNSILEEKLKKDLADQSQQESQNQTEDAGSTGKTDDDGSTGSTGQSGQDETQETLQAFIDKAKKNLHIAIKIVEIAENTANEAKQFLYIAKEESTIDAAKEKVESVKQKIFNIEELMIYSKDTTDIEIAKMINNNAIEAKISAYNAAKEVILAAAVVYKTEAESSVSNATFASKGAIAALDAVKNLNATHAIYNSVLTAATEAAEAATKAAEAADEAATAATEAATAAATYIANGGGNEPATADKDDAMDQAVKKLNKAKAAAEEAAKQADIAMKKKIEAEKAKEEAEIALKKEKEVEKAKKEEEAAINKAKAAAEEAKQTEEAKQAVDNAKQSAENAKQSAENAKQSAENAKKAASTEETAILAQKASEAAILAQNALDAANLAASNADAAATASDVINAKIEADKAAKQAEEAAKQADIALKKEKEVEKAKKEEEAAINKAKADAKEAIITASTAATAAKEAAKATKEAAEATKEAAGQALTVSKEASEAATAAETSANAAVIEAEAAATAAEAAATAAEAAATAAEVASAAATDASKIINDANVEKKKAEEASEEAKTQANIAVKKKEEVEKEKAKAEAAVYKAKAAVYKAKAAVYKAKAEAAIQKAFKSVKNANDASDAVVKAKSAIIIDLSVASGAVDTASSAVIKAQAAHAAQAAMEVNKAVSEAAKKAIATATAAETAATAAKTAVNEANIVVNEAANAAKTAADEAKTAADEAIKEATTAIQEAKTAEEAAIAATTAATEEAAKEKVNIAEAATNNAKKAADEADNQAKIAAQKKTEAEEAKAKAASANAAADAALADAADAAAAASAASATADAKLAEKTVSDAEKYATTDVQESVIASSTASAAKDAATKAAEEAKAASSAATKAAEEAKAALSAAKAAEEAKDSVAASAAADNAKKAADEADKQAKIAAGKKIEANNQKTIATNAAEDIKKYADKFKLFNNNLESIIGDDPDDLAKKVLEEIGKNVEFEEFISTGQTGGGEENLKKFKNLVSSINFYGNIFNTNVIIHLISLMSYDNYFEDLWDKITTYKMNKITTYKMNKKKFINLFFIDVTNCFNIIKILKNNNKNINNIIFRDTYIYTTHDNDNNNLKLFIVNAFKLLYNYCRTLNISTLFPNYIISRQLALLLYQIISNLKNIFITKIDDNKTQYDIIFEQRANIENKFKKLFKDKSIVSTYLNVRSDDNINPRFELSNNISSANITNFNLEIDYYNTDKKIYNVNDRDINTKEKYVFGPFNYIFKSNINEVIATKIFNDLLEKINNKKPEPLFFIGYGQSGSGKTSNLIYLDNINTQKKEPGIIQYFCNLFINKNIEHKYSKLEIDIRNLYVYFGNNATNTNTYKNEFTKIYSINERKNFTIKNFSNKNIWKCDDNIDLGQYIINTLKKRETEPTSKNIISSRSHILIFLTLSSNDESSVQKICIGDFAGVENEFNCEKLIKDFDISYKNSNKYENQPIPLDNIVVNQEKLKPEFLNEKKHKEYIDTFNEINESIKDLSCDKNIRIGTYDTDKTPDENIKAINDQISDLENKSKKNDDYDILMKIYIFERFLEVLPDLSEAASNKTKPLLYNIDFFTYRLDEIKKYKSNIKKYNSNITGKEDLNNIITGLKAFDNQYNGIENLTLKALYNINDKENITKLQELLDTVFEFIATAVKHPNKSEITFDLKLRNNLKKVNDGYGAVAKYFIQKKDNLTVIENPYIDEYIENKKKTKQKMEETNTEINKLKCIIANIKKIRYNCKLRNDEGYMINKTLKDLRMDIENLVKNSIIIGKDQNIITKIKDFKFKDNKSLVISDDNIKIFPFIIDNNIHPYCRNINMLKSHPYEKYDDYDNFKEITFRSNIIKELTDHNIELNNLNFVIFTVINVSSTVNGIEINNPPNPPYIQLNDLKTAIIHDDNNEIIKNVGNLLNVLKNYNFYNTLDYNIYGNNLNNLDVFFKEKADNHTKKDIAKFLENLIENNNALTLIGTLYATDLLKNITEYNFPCVVKNTVPNIKPALKLENNYNFNYNQLGGYKNKYLKYKIKYLELKQKLKIKL